VRPDTGSALNLEEAKAVVRSVVDLVRHHPGATIGVLTPFAAQATHIQNRLEAVLTEQERMTASLAVGTAHRLQGDERDIIVFSPVTSEGLDARSLSWLTGSPNLFNVAVTRAKSYLLVVGDWHYCSEMSGPLGELAKYARDVTVQRRVEKETASGQLHSPAERLLFEAMLRAGFEVTPKSIVQGYECDFVIKGGALAVNVECDGRHHYTAVGRQRLQDRARDELIRHQGLKVVRIPAWQCLSNPDAITRDLQLQLERPDGRSAGR
jgi:very-short-patch-repair endonuclease